MSISQIAMETEPKLCACGCGQVVTALQSDFAPGHSRNGRPEDRPFCACGCGQRVEKAGNEFLFNHHRNLQGKDLLISPEAFPFCACGCGERVSHPMARWIRGHSSRKYCACGCGEPVAPHHRYVKDHHKRKQGEPGLCECGCGERVAKIGNRFVKGHSTRMRYRHLVRSTTCPLCACGCGRRVAKPTNRWIRGHQSRQFATMGPTEHEALAQRAFCQRGYPFLFNLSLFGHSRPDFQFPQVRMIVEIDGYTHSTARQRLKDEDFDRYVIEQGWLVLRWTNTEVRNSLPALMNQFAKLYRSRLLSCQGSVKPDPADEPRV